MLMGSKLDSFLANSLDEVIQLLLCTPNTLCASSFHMTTSSVPSSRLLSTSFSYLVVETFLRLQSKSMVMEIHFEVIKDSHFLIFNRNSFFLLEWLKVRRDLQYRCNGRMGLSLWWGFCIHLESFGEQFLKIMLPHVSDLNWNSAEQQQNNARMLGAKTVEKAWDKL